MQGQLSPCALQTKSYRSDGDGALEDVKGTKIDWKSGKNLTQKASYSTASNRAEICPYISSAVLPSQETLLLSWQKQTSSFQEDMRILLLSGHQRWLFETAFQQTQNFATSPDAASRCQQELKRMRK